MSEEPEQPLKYLNIDGGGLQRREDGSYICPRCGQGRNIHFIGSQCAGCEHCITAPRSAYADTSDALREAEKRRDEWQKTALQQARNADYYCGLLDQIAEIIGREAYVGEDGREQEEPVRAKLPTILAARLEGDVALDKEREAWHARLRALEEAAVAYAGTMREFLDSFGAMRDNEPGVPATEAQCRRHWASSEALDTARRALYDECVKYAHRP